MFSFKYNNCCFKIDYFLGFVVSVYLLGIVLRAVQYFSDSGV
ncbi:hypothetical protein SAMN05660206_101269 [Sphingobacterium wenxiniae]|uniref:Uncharacterized protein n=1 Tax=Sphingobacterium wenxiniae TaxID=683125 RepID=A0A1I6P3V4_9SPHI|nr:hypothetical protein SAMN05660206_101269 [Sphingobacterium wenxiniae]